MQALKEQEHISELSYFIFFSFLFYLGKSNQIMLI